jgi:ribosomal protein L24E
MLRLFSVVALALQGVSAWTASPAARPASVVARMTPLTMVDQFRFSKAKAGSKANLADAPSDISWAKAAWDSAKDEIGEECYMVSDMAPDAAKEWYFCSNPSEDPNMTCEKLPEWMGKMKDGSTVYICSTPKVA